MALRGKLMIGGAGADDDPMALSQFKAGKVKPPVKVAPASSSMVSPQ